MLEDVIIYPKKLVVQVALDNGEITGLSATDYVLADEDRTITPPALSMEEARTILTVISRFTHNIALIENDLNEEVICHEFTGKINGGIYRIYMNGTKGMEEKIEHIQAADQEAQGV